jgi:heme exporter protein B
VFMTSFLAILKRDIALGLRQGGGAGSALAFMLSVLVLVPLALGPDQNLLRRLAPGIMWLSLLLAVLLTAERIFQQDYEDGTLDALVGIALPLELVTLAKALAHWLSVGLPLAIMAPLLGILVNVETASIPLLMLAMVLGSLSLSLLAAIGGSITAGLRRGGLLVALLILPLYVPVLVFGVSSTLATTGPSGSFSSLLIQLAITMVSLVIQPWASAAALRSYFR